MVSEIRIWNIAEQSVLVSQQSAFSDESCPQKHLWSIQYCEQHKHISIYLSYIGPEAKISKPKGQVKLKLLALLGDTNGRD